jgi:hypothetical protein
MYVPLSGLPGPGTGDVTPDGPAVAGADGDILTPD